MPSLTEEDTTYTIKNQTNLSLASAFILIYEKKGNPPPKKKTTNNKDMGSFIPP